MQIYMVLFYFCVRNTTKEHHLKFSSIFQDILKDFWLRCSENDDYLIDQYMMYAFRIN